MGRTHEACAGKYFKLVQKGDRPKRKIHWTDKENKRLLALVKEHRGDWKTTSDLIMGRSCEACRNQYTALLKQRSILVGKKIESTYSSQKIFDNTPHKTYPHNR